MNLAIKGHVTRYKEVIELLEMMGGKNKEGHNGNNPNVAYYISHKNTIVCDCVPYICDVYTLEEFLKKHPYKVGDKVQRKGAMYCDSFYEVEKMQWMDNHVEYTTKHFLYNNCYNTFAAEYLQPYKEETMEIKPNQIKNKNAFIDIANAEYNDVNTIELLCSDMFDVEIIHEDKIVLKRKKPQYPKSYDECVDMFNFTVETANLETFKALRELIYCRNSYWKIAGEQMGLGEPWKPENPSRHYIFTIENCADNIIENAITDRWRSRILVFPTAEIRDTFYENFKDLIELCKDFL